MISAIDERIIQLVKTGAHYSEIGERLGLSKNSISGRVKRMKDRGVVIPFPIKKIERKPEPPPKTITPKVKKEVQTITPLDYGTGKSLIDLPHNGCKYPTGYESGEHLFCGELRRDVLTSYCCAHHKLVWIKPRAAMKKQEKVDDGERQY